MSSMKGTRLDLELDPRMQQESPDPLRLPKLVTRCEARRAVHGSERECSNRGGQDAPARIISRGSTLYSSVDLGLSCAPDTSCPCPLPRTPFAHPRIRVIHLSGTQRPLKVNSVATQGSHAKLATCRGQISGIIRGRQESRKSIPQKADQFDKNKLDCCPVGVNRHIPDFDRWMQHRETKHKTTPTIGSDRTVARASTSDQACMLEMLCTSLSNTRYTSRTLIF